MQNNYIMSRRFEAALATPLREDKSRPLYQNMMEAEAWYHFRQPLYLKYADQVIEVDKKSVAEIAQEIAFCMYGK